MLIDTNLWVYLYAKTPQDKHLKTKELITNNFQFIIVSTQILGELYNVLTKKNFRSKTEAKEIMLETVATFTVLEIHANVAARELPNAHLRIFERWGHFPQLEHSEDFNALVLEFLAD